MSSPQRSRASFVLLLLSVSASHVTGAPSSSTGDETFEISGDELPDTLKDSPFTKWKSLTIVLISMVSNLRDQQFVEQFAERKENMTNYQDHQLELPRMHNCSSSNFNKERCLLHISSGLQLYSEYLEFVQREDSKPASVFDIRSRTKTLTDHVIKLMKNSKHVEQLNSGGREQLLSAIQTASAWEKKITVHVLLREYRTFLIQTFRALRRIEQRSTKRTILKQN